MARSFERTLGDDLLSDDIVLGLLEQLTPAHRSFLVGLGRGLAPAAAARRAGWKGAEADRIAVVYMEEHPIVRRLAAHIVRLRELAMLDGEPLLEASCTVH